MCNNLDLINTARKERGIHFGVKNNFFNKCQINPYSTNMTESN